MFQLEHRSKGAKERWTKGGFPIQEFKTGRWLQEGPYSFFLIVHKYNNTSYNPTQQTCSNYEDVVALKIIVFHNTLSKRELEGCVHYIFASSFLSLKASNRETGENAFYLTSKALFILVKIKF